MEKASSSFVDSDVGKPMIPPNAAPPKTIVIAYPGAEEKTRKQYVYQTYLSSQEHDRIALVPGNRLVVKFKDEVVGEGQAILVEKTTLERLSTMTRCRRATRTRAPKRSTSFRRSSRGSESRRSPNSGRSSSAGSDDVRAPLRGVLIRF